MLKRINKNIILGSLAILLAAFLWSLDDLLFFLYIFISILETFFRLLSSQSFYYFKLAEDKDDEQEELFSYFMDQFFGGLIGTIFITKSFFLVMNGEVYFSTIVLLQNLQPVFALFLARIILKKNCLNNFTFGQFQLSLLVIFLFFIIIALILKIISHSAIFLIIS